jgi:hypothetical protein
MRQGLTRSPGLEFEILLPPLCGHYTGASISFNNMLIDLGNQVPDGEGGFTCIIFTTNGSPAMQLFLSLLY